MGVQQHGEPDAEGGPIHRLVVDQAERMDAGVVPVHVVNVAVRMGRRRFRLDPAQHLLALGGGVVDIGAEHHFHIDLAVLADQEARLTG